MLIEALTVGMFLSNCYVIACEDTGEGIIIDAGDEGEKILAFVKKRKLKVRAIINTHAHIDHVSALPLVASSLSVPVFMHNDDLYVYRNLSYQASLFGLEAPEGVVIDRFLKDGDKVTFGKIEGEVIHTPGHSPGSISLIFSDENPQRLFSGDTLFKGSIGRTDLYGGDYAQMMETLKTVFLPLQDRTIVYPGHGEITTVGEEKRLNPFMIHLY